MQKTSSTVPCDGKILLFLLRASLVAQTVKHLLTMRETRVRSLGWEDPLEKEMATHYSTLAWKMPWTEEHGSLHTVHGVAKSWTRLSDFTFTFRVGSGLSWWLRWGKASACNAGDPGSIPGLGR